MSTLIDFYNNKLIDILSYNDTELESIHTYIQWLFPLDTTSLYNENAPVLSSSGLETFQNSKELQQKLLKAFKVMLRFYGFETQNDKIVKADNFEEKAKNWLALTPYRNHNMLRISRILRSLTLLGCNKEAKEFLKALTIINKEYPKQTNDSFRYWEQAVLI